MQPPRWPQPGEMWSLWEMLKTYAADFVLWANIISDQMNMVGVEVSDHNARRVDDEWIEKNLHPRLKDNGIALPATNAQGARWQAAVANNPHDPSLPQVIAEFRSRMEDELNGHRFYYVRPDLVWYYDEKQPFGLAVPAAFYLLDDEVHDAGKCLALGQGTACVFHLMRVMEAALKRLAKELGIPYAPSWEAYIKQITAKIGEKHKSKSVKWRRQEPFFRDALGDLQAIKIAWRNPTMHVVRRYSVSEAKQVYGTVQHFMNRFAWFLMPPGWTPPKAQSS